MSSSEKTPWAGNRSHEAEPELATRRIQMFMITLLARALGVLADTLALQASMLRKHPTVGS